MSRRRRLGHNSSLWQHQTTALQSHSFPLSLPSSCGSLMARREDQRIAPTIQSQNHYELQINLGLRTFTHRQSDILSYPNWSSYTFRHLLRTRLALLHQPESTPAFVAHWRNLKGLYFTSSHFESCSIRLSTCLYVFCSLQAVMVMGSLRSRLEEVIDRSFVIMRLRDDSGLKELHVESREIKQYLNIYRVPKLLLSTLCGT